QIFDRLIFIFSFSTLFLSSFFVQSRHGMKPGPAKQLNEGEPVKVVVRIRPEGPGEEPSNPVILVRDAHTVELQPPPTDSGRSSNSSDVGAEGCDTTAECSNGGTNKHKPPARKLFTFDRVFGRTACQADVYEQARPLVRSAVQGYNATIFAHGHTSSGKTYTMTGTSDMPGIIPRAIRDVFAFIREIAASDSDTIFIVRVSHVELYNNTFRNLLEGVADRHRNAEPWCPDAATGRVSTGNGGGDDGFGDGGRLPGAASGSGGGGGGGRSSSSPTCVHPHASSRERDGRIVVRESQRAGVFLSGPGLRFTVTSAAEAMRLVRRGDTQRAVGLTQCNEHSSRSHSIVTLHIESQSRDPAAAATASAAANAVANAAASAAGSSGGGGRGWGGSSNLNSSRGSTAVSETSGSAAAAAMVGPVVRLGKLHLVDLAGSERLSLSGAEGERLVESQSINLSLSSLGNVLASLSKNAGAAALAAASAAAAAAGEGGMSGVAGGAAAPVPYRDSKLTFFLKDSLGGNSKTLMVTTLRTLPCYHRQSMISLLYSSRAKKIRNRTRLNTDTAGNSGLCRVTAEMEELRARLRERTLEMERLVAERALEVKRLSRVRESCEAGREASGAAASEEAAALRTKLTALGEANEREKRELEGKLAQVIHSHTGQLAAQHQQSLTLMQHLQQQLGHYQQRVACQQQEIEALRAVAAAAAAAEATGKDAAASAAENDERGAAATAAAAAAEAEARAAAENWRRRAEGVERQLAAAAATTEEERRRRVEDARVASADLAAARRAEMALAGGWKRVQWEAGCGVDRPLPADDLVAAVAALRKRAEAAAAELDTAAVARDAALAARDAATAECAAVVAERAWVAEAAVTATAPAAREDKNSRGLLGAAPAAVTS
ncbi:unnamed protein product, partial [Phaeothamnion confervicola]